MDGNFDLKPFVTLIKIQQLHDNPLNPSYTYSCLKSYDWSPMLLEHVNPDLNLGGT